MSYRQFCNHETVSRGYIVATLTFRKARLPMYLRALCSIALLVLAGCAKEEPPAPAKDLWSPYAWVFFAFDSTELNQGSWRALADFVSQQKNANDEYAKWGHPNAGGRFLVCGHSDTAGSTQAKLAVSKRRAEAVRDALVLLGIPADQISVLGVGDRNLIVPTPDGVREVQNRDVMVELEHPLYFGDRGRCRSAFKRAKLLPESTP